MGEFDDIEQLIVYYFFQLRPFATVRFIHKKMGVGWSTFILFLGGEETQFEDVSLPDIAASVMSKHMLFRSLISKLELDSKSAEKRKKKGQGSKYVCLNGEIFPEGCPEYYLSLSKVANFRSFQVKLLENISAPMSMFSETNDYELRRKHRREGGLLGSTKHRHFMRYVPEEPTRKYKKDEREIYSMHASFSS